MQQFTLGAGTVVHINGLPFYLVHNTVFEGHPANVQAATVQDPDDGHLFVINFNAIRRPLWKRLIGIR